MATDYEHFLTNLLVDLVAISLLTYALYFRRHQRRDLTLGFMGVNIGLLAVCSFATTSGCVQHHGECLGPRAAHL